MAIGYFGEDIIFETSAEKVLTFNDFKHTSAAVVEQHKIIGKKPLSEFCGEELDSVSFSINLNANLGVKPQEIIDKLIDLKKKGMAETLVIGGKSIGLDKFIIKEVSTAYEKVYNNGFLFSAKVDLTLEEYISDTSLNVSSIGTENSTGYYSRPSVNTAYAQTVINSIGNTYNLDGNNTAMQPLLTGIVKDLY